MDIFHSRLSTVIYFEYTIILFIRVSSMFRKAHRFNQNTEHDWRVVRDLRFEICIYLSRRITAIANGQMAAGPGKGQWQVGPGHWQHFVVHLRYPGVPSIIEGRAGAAEVDFPPPSRKRMEKGDRVGYTYRGSLENLYTEREGVVYTTEGRLDLIRWWFFNETSHARHLRDWPWFTAPVLRGRRKGRRNATRNK